MVVSDDWSNNRAVCLN